MFKYKYMSFFSGALGLDLGLEESGFEAISYNEVEKVFCETIKLNKPKTKLYDTDIRNLTPQMLLKEHNLKKGELFAVVGGPPCQAFSTAGKRNSLNDDRGNVFLHFIDIIEGLQPKYAIIENVRGLLSAPLKHRPHSLRGEDNMPLAVDELPGGALAFIIKKLNKAGYTVSFTLYDAANFGVPQKRERVVIFASRNGEEIPFIEPTHSDKNDNLAPWLTVKDAIGKMKNLKNHEHVNFPEKRLKFFRLLKAGQNWRSLPEQAKIEAMGKSLHSGGGKTGFYRRLAWDLPSPTVVTSPTMPATDLCHPDLDRPLSVQEYAAIQTFPENYKFAGKILDKYKQIGNAVPCKLGKAIGEHLIKFDKGILRSNEQDGRLSRYLNTDHRSWLKSVGIEQTIN
jgi:DNA (cytosine-5)-methyltransferase 1